MFLVLSELHKLHAQVRASRLAAYAPGTRSNFQSQWLTYLIFCYYFELEALPSSVQVLSYFAQFLSRSITIASVRNYFNGVKVLHLLLELPTIVFDSFQLSLLLKGLAKLNPHTSLSKLPITPSLLLAIHSHLDLTTPLHSTLWCAYLLAFFLFARKSNMVPPSRKKFEPSKHLCRRDISVCPSGLSILLKWSKTNQTSARLVQIPLVSIPNSPLCPLAAFQNMVRVMPASPSSPAFTLPGSKSTKACLTHSTFVSHLLHLISLTGRDSHGFSGHSFRRGGATFAFGSGVQGELIQLQGDWQSEAYLRYLDFSLESKLQVSSKMAIAIQNLKL